MHKKTPFLLNTKIRWKDQTKEILLEIERATGDEFFRLIESLRKTRILPTDMELFLAFALDSFARARFRVKPGEKILSLSLAYAIVVSRTHALAVEDFLDFFVEQIQRLRKWKAPKEVLTSEQKKSLIEKQLLTTKEVGLLFGVKRRQVQKWINQNKMKRVRDGVLREQYLAFSKKSVKHGDVFVLYLKLVARKRE